MRGWEQVVLLAMDVDLQPLEGDRHLRPPGRDVCDRGGERRVDRGMFGLQGIRRQSDSGELGVERCFLSAGVAVEQGSQLPGPVLPVAGVGSGPEVPGHEADALVVHAELDEERSSSAVAVVTHRRAPDRGGVEPLQPARGMACCIGTNDLSGAAGHDLLFRLLLEESAPSMPDLDNRGAIHDLVIHFYREVAFDDLLGPLFGEVAEVDWAEHIPRLIGYWCRVLLSHPSYDGRILAAHERVHDQESFDAELFGRWYRLFVESVDSGWTGTYADRAKQHAAHMAGVISRRLTGEDFDVVQDLRP